MKPSPENEAPRGQFNEATIAAAAVAALGWGLAYVLWRAAGTITGDAALLAGAVLLLAEIVGLLLFAARVRIALRPPASFAPVPGVPLPDVTVVVDGTDADPRDLHATLIAVRRVEGVRAASVVGLGGSLDLQALAGRLGVAVDERSRGDAIAAAPSSWVLLVRAGEVIDPTIVEAAAPLCSAPDMAVVQVGFDDADPASPHHDPLGQWSIRGFEQHVQRRSLATAPTMPWFGDGPALVRRSALMTIDGFVFDGDHVSEWETGLTLARNGFRVTAVAQTLARVRRPANIEQASRTRWRNQRARLAMLAPSNLGWWRDLPSGAATAHTAVAIGPLSSFYRWLLVLAAVLVLGFAQVPIAAAPEAFIVAAAPAYLLRWNANLMIGRGHLRPGSLLRAELQHLGADANTVALAGPPRLLGGAGLLVATMGALALAVALGAAGVWRDRIDPLPGEYIAIAMVLSAGLLGIGVAVLIDALLNRQRRRHRRTRLGQVTCRLGEFEGRLADVSSAGAGVELAGTADSIAATLCPGGPTTLSFRIPDAVGAWRSVSTVVTVMYVGGDTGSVRAGVAFDDPTSGALDPVIEFLDLAGWRVPVLR